MMYQRSKEIEQRLSEVLRLVRSGRYSTPRLAEKLGVSVPTISRCIESLKGRGYQIRSRNTGRGWRYVLEGKPLQCLEPGNQDRGDSTTFQETIKATQKAGSS